MLVLAHRGASAAAPENTPDAFRLADVQGADGVELDVRITPGGALVVRHDPLPSGSVVETMPSLTDVLVACGDRMLVNIEIKNLASDGGFDPTMTIVELTIEELLRRGPAEHDRWLISSFSWATIEAVRRSESHIATALLCVDPDGATVERVARAGHRGLHPWHGNVTESMVDRVHDLGMLINTWTCNEPNRLRELADLGVDGVCTDDPSLALQALGRDGVNALTKPGWGTPA